MAREALKPLLATSHLNQAVPIAHSILQTRCVGTNDSHGQTVRLRGVEHLDVEVAEEHSGQQRGDGHGEHRTNDGRARNGTGIYGVFGRR